MKKLLLAFVLLASVCAAPARAATLPCGLSTDGPLWVQFGDGSVDFRFDVLGKPGVVVAANGIAGPERLREQGAKTVYWIMHVWNYVGTPKAPADPATIPAVADALVQDARTSSGCDTPVIGLNELWGAYRASPWEPATAQYRANILSLVQEMAARGASPFLLVPGTPAPFLDGDARVWWLQVAQAARIVREMHFSGPLAYRKGPIVGARARRIAMRTGLEDFMRIGISADRLGMQLGFQSGPGAEGGRGDLPPDAWLEIVKQETLGAKEVAGELGISSVWTWGWGSFGPSTSDPIKPVAACVHLWALDQSLCDGPGMAGRAFNASLTLGQIALPPGIQCSTSLGFITVDDVDALRASVGGSDSQALTALLSRLVYEEAGASLSSTEVDSARAAVIARSFGNDPQAYQTALAASGLDDPSARTILADQLARQRYGALVQIRDTGSSPHTVIERRVRELLRNTICLRDVLPAVEDFDWAGRLPSLRVPPAAVSIRAQRAVAPKGSRIRLSGRISNALAPQTVTVYARPAKGGAFVPVGAAQAGSTGEWSLTVAPRARTYYRALARLAASPPILVKVHAR